MNRNRQGTIPQVKSQSGDAASKESCAISSLNGREQDPPESQAPDLLDSWKEIARYLGREVRTVQRWEKSEHLPVHRHIHQKNGSIYAFKNELDAWRESRTRTAVSVPIAIPGSNQLLTGSRLGDSPVAVLRGGRDAHGTAWKPLGAGVQLLVLHCPDSLFDPAVLQFFGHLSHTPEEITDGMGYPSARRNRPELRSKFIRQR
jgi:hypothetical protein